VSAFSGLSAALLRYAKRCVTGKNSRRRAITRVFVTARDDERRDAVWQGEMHLIRY
jgi:hypothetical protein